MISSLDRIQMFADGFLFFFLHIESLSLVRSSYSLCASGLTSYWDSLDDDYYYFFNLGYTSSFDGKANRTILEISERMYNLYVY